MGILQSDKMIVDGRVIDAPLHLSMLEDADANKKSDRLAIRIAMELGFSREEAEKMCGGVFDVQLIAGTAKKSNPYHDAEGLFTSKDKASGGAGEFDEAFPYSKKLRTWSGGYEGGTGAAHLDFVVLDQSKGKVDGVNLEWVSDDGLSYLPRGLAKTKEAREAGTVIEYRAVHPDEPHMGWDTEIFKAYGFKGVKGPRGVLDTSPPNPRLADEKVMKYWSTGGTRKAQNHGAGPQCGVIRFAADEHFGIKSVGKNPREDSTLEDVLEPTEADRLAKLLVTAIHEAPPKQPTLWRGIGGEQAEALLKATAGDTIQFTVGSTSRDAGAALQYGSVILRIVPGAKGYANRKYFDHDQEVVTGGKFRVLGQSKSKTHPDVTVIDLEQTETFVW